MAEKKQSITTQQAKKAHRDYTYAVGRAKEAVARVRLHDVIKDGLVWGDHAVSKEQMLVNEMPIEHYFSGPVSKAMYGEPLRVANVEGKFAWTIKVAGGGMNGQLDAVINGIAQALSEFDEKTFRPLMKSRGFLTRDARVRERRKVGTGGKARRKKQSPKR